MPIATGRFAAMIGGKIKKEDIVFNDETLWSGGPYNPNNSNGPSILANIRKYVLEKDYVKATDEGLKLNSTPTSVQHYQPMGILNIVFDGINENAVTNYKRKLSMDSALVSVSYTINGIDYNREVFASYPDQVIVMRITASRLRTKTPVKILLDGNNISFQQVEKDLYVFKVCCRKEISNSCQINF